MLLRVIAATARTQIRLTSRNIEDALPIIVMPLQTVIAMAILVESGRTDLAGSALSTSLLFTVGQMGFFISSEIVSHDRSNQLIELLIATPSPYAVILGIRTLMLTSLGLLGFAEGWLIAYLIFGVAIPIYHPVILATTLVATALAGGGTSVLTATLFSLARSTRTLQHAVNGPFYLLGGILVPVSYLPVWLQPFSPVIFFYWSANLVRDALQQARPDNVALRIAILVALGAVAAVGGAFLMTRMIGRLRQQGKLGLA